MRSACLFRLDIKQRGSHEDKNNWTTDSVFQAPPVINLESCSPRILFALRQFKDARLTGRPHTNVIRMPLLRLSLIIIMLGGCQSLQPLSDVTVLSDESFARLWRIYTRCRSSVEPDEMRQDTLRLSHAVRSMSETMNRSLILPQGVQRLIEETPLRLSVDPGAMAMACALHAGQAAQATGQTLMAVELFHFILSKDQEPPYTYYVVQARLGLAQMQTKNDPASERVEQIVKVSARHRSH